VPVPADLVFAAANAEALREIASWDGFRPATFAASEFPVDVVRFERSPSPPVVGRDLGSMPAPFIAALMPLALPSLAE